MGQPSPPTPHPAKDYKQSLKVYLKFLPQLLAGEQKARETYDPQRIQEQMNLQDVYGARQAQQQLDALQRIDPQGVAVRQQLGNAVQSDLASGYNLPPGLDTAVTSQIRGSEAARGQVLGNAAISAEDLYKGNAMQALYQKHLENAGSFLAGATPEQMLTLVQPVTPDRSSQYVNPSAAGQLAAPNFQNQLAAWQASGAGRNPWAGAATGAVGGAAQGAAAGPYGAAAGAIIGGAAGYFSDRRAKHSIVYVGKSESGIPIAEFCYNDCSGRYRGVIAQDVLSIKPQAVHMDATGLWKVDYDKIDVEFEAIPDLVEA